MSAQLSSTSAITVTELTTLVLDVPSSGTVNGIQVD